MNFINITNECLNHIFVINNMAICKSIVKFRAEQWIRPTQKNRPIRPELKGLQGWMVSQVGFKSNNQVTGPTQPAQSLVKKRGEEEEEKSYQIFLVLAR